MTTIRSIRSAGLVLALAGACGIATAADINTRTPATFTKDVAPILQEKCQDCHRPGAMAPMSLLTYQEARPWAKSIKERVVQRQMPPWFLDKTVGIQHFSNDISLSDSEIATIKNWVDAGAPQGDPKDMPVAKKFDDTGWKLSKIMGKEPDMIIEGPDYDMPAHGQDQWARPTTNINLDHPRWVRAVEMRPSNQPGRKMFHHILANLSQDETNAPSALVKVAAGNSNNGAGGAGAGLLMEWAIGKGYDIYRPGAGKLLMPGARIRWEYHVHASGEEIKAHPQLGVYFYPEGETPNYRTYLTLFGASTPGGGLDLAPNTITASQGYHVLRSAARLENFQPHMHLRGKAMLMEAILPTGQIQTLSFVDHFNFNWMTNYIYSDDDAPVLPKGTIVHVVAWHDNTTGNPNNPDPNQWVGYGDRTVDEMAHAWVNVTYITDEDYAEWSAKHPRAMASARGQQPQQ
jgi:hypothetical protein